MTTVHDERHVNAPRVQTFDRLHVVRTRDRIDLARSAGWPFWAVYAEHGQVELVREREWGGPVRVELAAGDVVVVPSRVGTRVVTSAGGSALAVCIHASTAAGVEEALTAAAGQPWSTLQGTASLVAHVLEAIGAQQGDHVPAEAGRLSRHVVGLIASMCTEGVGPAEDERAVLHGRAKDYVEIHLSELDLGPHRVAAALNVSVRTLHRLFEHQDTTLAGWIRLRRLERCRVELLRSAPSQPVSAIGARWGLWDAAHFSRAFKGAFGTSPYAYRALHRGHECGPTCDPLTSSPGLAEMTA